jgi:hypothetical protein
MACVQEIATLKPGTAEQYLDALASHWLAIAARRGLRLVGAYRTAMRDTEAVVLWCLPSFAALTGHLGTLAADPAARSWQERAGAWRVGYRETLLVPSIWCVTHPDWREPVRPRPSPSRRRRRSAA